jgi:glycine/D-amino acid oxidase-like deaminating enzyme/nitrite reductase/ring-hydroxylating ferredoxin subunit
VRRASLWFENVRREARQPLAADVHADVAVLGAGIVGLTTAVLLERQGASVVVLEARHVGAGASGYNTAKLTSLHGLTYARLARTLGAEKARLYGESNEAGIEAVFELAGDLGLDCDLRRKANFTYTESADERGDIEQEVEAARAAGLPASYADTVDLPYPVAGAVRFENQAEFHPVAYLEGLARALGDRVHEGTTAVSVRAGSPCRVSTAAGQVVTAEQVVVATHLPFLDRGLFFARCHPERSYVVAGRVARPPSAMYLSTEQPAHSIRAHGDWLLVGGESHKTGQADAARRYGALAAWARERFGLEPELRWATQDQVPVDGVPYVGRLDPVSRGLWVATGFRKWGLAMGTSAARLLADLIGGRDNEWRELFDPLRVRPRAAAPSFAKENANVGLRFVGDRLTKRARPEDVPRGEGRIVGAGHGQRAVHRDDEGRLHVLSARCTHLGCIVNWNSGERTWDCPCHGSRFTAEGQVIEGPAVRPLRKLQPPG